MSSVKIEVVLNFLFKGLNSIAAIYFAINLNETSVLFFAFMALLNVLKSFDFGYNYVQRHLAKYKNRLKLSYEVIILLFPISIAFVLESSWDLEFIFFTLPCTYFLKYNGTHANIINKTWLIPVPITIGYVSLFISFIDFKISILLSSFIIFLYLKYKEKNLNFKVTSHFDKKLFSESIFIFIPSAAYLLVNEYVFIFNPNELTRSSEWIPIFLKLNALVISLIYLFNDMYWNRSKSSVLPLLDKYVLEISAWFLIVISVATPNLLTIIFLNAIIGLQTGAYIRLRQSTVLFVSGIVEVSFFLILFNLLGLDKFLLICSLISSIKWIILKYGKR